MITYLELLEMIRDGIAPEKIKYQGIIYSYWNDCIYRTSGINKSFSEILSESLNEKRLTAEKCIEIIEEQEEIEKLDETGDGHIDSYLEKLVMENRKTINKLTDKINKYIADKEGNNGR